MEMPPVRYAKSADVNIAYQITGEGAPLDLVLAPGTLSHLAFMWNEPRLVQMIERFSRFSRLIRFDKRGTGMSDRVTDAATLEERADDIRAVMDAARSENAVLLGISEGGSMACVFAAMHPVRVRALIVWGCQARFSRTADYPWGVSQAEEDARLAALVELWPSREYVRNWGAGVGKDADDSVVDTILHRMQMAASPAAVVALERMNKALDIRDVLPAIRVPTLVMAREGDPLVDPAAVRDLAERIPGARVRLFPGKTHFMGAPWLGIDPEPVYAAIEEFATGSPVAPGGDRFLTTIAFLDIVGSTVRASELGDRAWRELLDQHFQLAREALRAHRGTEVDSAGDGILATFEGPARAIQCMRAIALSDRELGVRIRAGVHVGEVERSGNAIRGINVHLAARVAAAAAAGEILVSSTVRDLCAGSGIQFTDRGPHALKGIAEQRDLLAVVD
jgi:pimeloyl-ACP methyl ester carboxylesterase/class 3 adenylate cyclase